MKPAPLRYVRPASLEEALRVLAAADAPEADDIKVLAGGQSLIPLLNLRMARPQVLVDIQAVPALHDLYHADGHVYCGAMVTLKRLEESRLLAHMIPVVPEAARLVAHPQIRSRGTLGGTLCHADPAAEIAVVCLALDASVEVQSLTGAPRWLPTRELIEGPLETTLTESELVTRVRFPVPPSDTTYAIREFAPRPGDFSWATVVAGLRANRRDDTVDVDISVGAIAATPATTRITLPAPMPGNFAHAVGRRARDAATAWASGTASEVEHKGAIVEELTVQCLEHLTSEAGK